jgi:hypothetical protein
MAEMENQSLKYELQIERMKTPKTDNASEKETYDLITSHYVWPNIQQLIYCLLFANYFVQQREAGDALDSSTQRRITECSNPIERQLWVGQVEYGDGKSAFL